MIKLSSTTNFQELDLNARYMYREEIKISSSTINYNLNGDKGFPVRQHTAHALRAEHQRPERRTATASNLELLPGHVQRDEEALYDKTHAEEYTQRRAVQTCYPAQR